ncbi:hypothetical protein OGAPHI_002803 [Ogataea philodendri]|uniref:Uncharacterized protein n=1 Tax=Ogataea philodendri TaxID=1378263 RepID=A0A9P8P9I2_9ASCO|nr:uncharacterized protein OGAPHI_002803 [Ogataea philodendri]KAH3667154.1 hypothetical protein OGAPHI_002803 [Ogataea philodendri]
MVSFWAYWFSEDWICSNTQSNSRCGRELNNGSTYSGAYVFPSWQIKLNSFCAVSGSQLLPILEMVFLIFGSCWTFQLLSSISTSNSLLSLDTSFTHLSKRESYSSSLSLSSLRSDLSRHSAVLKALPDLNVCSLSVINLEL